MVVIAAAALLLGTFASAAPVKFDIPAQPAHTALQAFVKQSGCEALFMQDELAKVQANEVKGKFEPADAIAKLLAGTGFNAQQTGPRNFLIKKAANDTTGSVKGSLTGEGGKGLPNVLVVIRETEQSTETDRYGVFVFPNVAAGTYVLVASAPGYQTMHIKDVSVKAGRDLTIGKEEMRKESEGPLALEPFEVHAETVEQLEKFEVTGTKQRPFQDVNVDIPRTINDVQPYYIIDSKTIDLSGAANVEDLLKQQLPMNAVAQTRAQMTGATTPAPASPLGTTSSLNLRGLGSAETLVLIDGRRSASVITLNGLDASRGQPDLNGIPLGAIERIEVLPTSASGIYGASALGGVVNVILKKNYSGGEIRTTYDNTFSTDAPTRTGSLSYGLGFNDSKTQVMLNAQWSDARALTLQDRRELVDRGLSAILANNPTYLFRSFVPFLGSLPNVITNASAPQPNLVLKSGSSLGAPITHVPAGTSPVTPLNTLEAGLLADAGSYNLSLPPTGQNPTGLRRPLSVPNKTQSYMASVRHEVTPTITMYLDAAHNENNSSLNAPLLIPNSGRFLVPVTSPINPFTRAVNVELPFADTALWNANTSTETITLGFVAKLPLNWTSEGDYTWSHSKTSTLSTSGYDNTALVADLANGTINPFVDTLQYPLNLKKYITTGTQSTASTLEDFAIRGSGPIITTLPSGEITLTLGLEHRAEKTPANIVTRLLPVSTSQSSLTTFFARQQSVDSAYMETLIPLVKKDNVPLLRALELQLAGRAERFAVDTGTPSETTNLSTGVVTYADPTNNGQPFSARTEYTAKNGTAGIKYEPVAGVTLRASFAQAFLPPTPDQLVRNPQPDPFTTTITDPKSGASYDVATISGGNPGLKPQHSKSRNAGIVWEPTTAFLKGLRLDVEYYKIDQFSSISTLDAQTIIDQASIYPDRVIRDPSGLITQVDVSAINLYKRQTEGWDFTLDYRTQTKLGEFNFHAAESIILHLKTQYDLTLPEYDAVNLPSEGGAAKYKSIGAFTWSGRHLTLGWTVRYVGAYNQYGGGNGAIATVFGPGVGVLTQQIKAQGSDTIPSQTYHDLFMGYSFGKSPRDNSSRWTKTQWLSDVTIQAGVRDLFNTKPPFDVYYNYYTSPYGDLRLRSYWITLKKAF